jgi:hypothetical protein
MLDITGALYTRLQTDTTLLALLATYGAGKAIVADPPPADLIVSASLPVLIIGGATTDEDEDSYTEALRRVSVSVRLYHRPAGSSLPLDTAAERVRDRLKSWPRGSVTGGNIIDAAVSGPVAGPTDDPSVEGRIVTARLLFLET